MKTDALNEFARYYGFHYDLIDGRQLVRDIRNEMDRGLKGLPSTLGMHPAYIHIGASVKKGKKVLALDAGGTNMRSALVSFDDAGKPVTEGLSKRPMPGSRGRMEAGPFFDYIAEQAAPLLEAEPDAAGIGFCFSYPMQITREQDGILLALSKEIDAPALIGKSIGQGLREALARRGVKAPQKIVLLNDTTATLLSGMANAEGPVVGLILGTGYNVAYPERNIPKINFKAGPKGRPQIVVCEAGNVQPYCLGYLDGEFDAGTQKPGVYRLEKSTSGAYLGPLTLHILKQAVRDGLLKFARQDEFLNLPTLETQVLDDWLWKPLSGEGPFAAFFGRDEQEAMKAAAYLATIVSERAGFIAAAPVAAAVEQMQAGSDPFRPVRVAVEGTTFMVYRYLRRAFETRLHQMLAGSAPCYYSVDPVDQASLFGAAVAALSE